MELHLLSSQGDWPIQDIVKACRPLLEDQDHPTLAYLPAASVGNRFVEVTEEAFDGLARVLTLDAQTDDRDGLLTALDGASVLYVPGGNTYLLSKRLHAARVVEEVRARVLGGLPLVAFSAGTVFCGMNVLTTNDMNCCACDSFTGLGLVPCNFNVHYPPDGEERELRDDRIWEYHRFFDHPVLTLEDGCHLRVVDDSIQLVEGRCRLLQKDGTNIEIGFEAIHASQI